jgi:hypothetical protein
MEPAWAVAHLFPPQGEWGEADYLALETTRLVELVNGHLEVPSTPTLQHQRIALFLYRALWSFLAARNLGEVLVALLPSM